MFRNSIHTMTCSLGALILTSGLMSSAVLANDAAPTLQDRFQQGQLQGYIQNMRSVQDDVKVIKDDARGPVLRMTYLNEYFVELRPQPVTPGQAYELSFDYRWDHHDTLETNPSLEAAAAHQRIMPQIETLPALTISYLNEKKEPLTDISGCFLLHGQWRSARFTQVAPRDAVHMVIKLRSGRNRGTLLVSKLALKPLPEVMTPQGIMLDFRQPSLDQTGRLWGSTLIDGQVRQSPEGTLVIYAPSRELGRFPLPGPGKYQLKVTGQPLTPASRLLLAYIDDQGKIIRGQSVSTTPAQRPEGIEFTPPAQAQSIQLTAREILLETVHITKLE